MNPQDFKEGDRAWPGAASPSCRTPRRCIGSARVDEVERGRLKLGHQATARVEAVPDRELKAHIESISALAKADFSSWPPPRNFDLRVALEGARSAAAARHDRHDPRGGRAVPNVLIVPVEAVFNSAGQDVVYVLGRDGVERRPVMVERRNGDRAVITEGLRPGERVAVEDPTTASGEARP